MFHKILLCHLVLCLSANLLFAKNYIVIGAMDVSMHEKPNRNSTLITKLQFGEIGELLEEGTTVELLNGEPDHLKGSCDAYSWYKIKVKQDTGWVFGAYTYHLRETHQILSKNFPTLRIAELGTDPKGAICFSSNFMVIYKELFHDSVSMKFIKIKEAKEALSSHDRHLGLMFSGRVLASFESANNKIVLCIGSPNYFNFDLEVFELRYKKEEDYYEATRVYLVAPAAN